MSIQNNDNRIDFLTLEVGSTITKANGFMEKAGKLVHIAQGFASTSVSEGNVGIGLHQAIENLEQTSGMSTDSCEVFANSSAAGGLRVTVHGLTYNMTSRAAKEASLGAGAIIKLITAGELTAYDLEEIEEIRPNMVILAGGVDFGARDIIVSNAIKLSSADLGVPVVYAGNSAIKRGIERIFEKSATEFIVAPNVFPEVDVLNLEPLRKIMQNLFSKHIIHAPGMDRLSSITNHAIIPTPAAVLKAAEMFYEIAGDLVVIDVGGATTDIHSVTEGSLEYADKLTAPEPKSKRTVEGDLGVFVNASNILEQSDEALQMRANEVKALPVTNSEKELTRLLCAKAVDTGIKRHAAIISDLFTPSGKKQVISGKDLSAVKWVVATGGALTKVEGGESILQNICSGVNKYLLPSKEARILFDKNYMFSALGTMCTAYPELVKNTFKEWITNND